MDTILGPFRIFCLVTQNFLVFKSDIFVTSFTQKCVYMIGIENISMSRNIKNRECSSLKVLRFILRKFTRVPQIFGENLWLMGFVSGGSLKRGDL